MKRVEFRTRGDGPPFLYVAGIEGTGRLFYKQTEDLARDHTVVSFPLRPAGRYTMDVLINDVGEILREIGAEREPATVLGESFGGVLAMSVALAFPTFLRRMILVNTFPWFANRRKIKFGVLAYSVLPYRLVRAYRKLNSGRELFGADVEAADRRLFREHTRVVPYEGYLSRMKIVRDVDLRPQLPRIKTPTLIVAGTADRLLDSVAAARTMVDALPRARLKLLPDTGHAALIARGVRVRDWLHEFESMEGGEA